MDPVAPEAERYALAHTSPPTAALAALREETETSTPIPEMAGGVILARLLEALVVASNATRVLEIGTFTGYSTLSIAAVLPPGGTITTLERDETVAAIARRHIDASQHAARIELVLGDALASLARLEGPFDLVFVDASKREYAAYYDAVLPKLADSGLIVVDNMLWGGAVLDEADAGEDTEALRAFADAVHADPRVHNALLTVEDGLMLVWKRR